MEFIVTVKIDARIQVYAKNREVAIELIKNATYVECDCGDVVYEDVDVWTCLEVERDETQP